MSTSLRGFWNRHYEKHVRKTAGGMPQAEKESADEFWSNYMRNSNPRGMTTDHIPSMLNLDHERALAEKGFSNE